MKLIFGLGNFGTKYQNTRHNVGHMVVDFLADSLKIKFLENKKLFSLLAEKQLGGEKVLLAKSTRFMNESGISVRKIVDFYKIKIENICIISDDLDLPLKTIRIREGGSSGGHKGLESVINNLKTNEFFRIRIGIAPLQGQPPTAEKLNYLNANQFVLENFTKPELKIIKKAVLKTTNLLLEYLKGKKLTAHTYHL